MYELGLDSWRYLVWTATSRYIRPQRFQQSHVAAQDKIKEFQFDTDLRDQDVQRRKLDLHLMWTTPASTFRKRNLKVLDTYLFQHPNAQVNIYASHLEPTMFKNYTEAGYHIRIIRLDDEYVVGLGISCLPDGKWMSRLEEWKRGPYYYSHITDFIRFCTLYKFGGVYSDFDALLLQRIDLWDAFIGKDSSGAGGSCRWCLPGGDMYLAPGVMGAPAGSPVLLEALRIGFDPETYDPQIFNQVGPMAITKAYKKHASSLQILDSTILYPVKYLDSPALFRRSKDAWARVEKLQRTSVSLHFYGHQTRQVQEEEGSVIAAVYDRYSVISDNCALKAPNFVEVGKSVRVLNDIRFIAGTCPGTQFELSIKSSSGELRLAGSKKFENTLVLKAGTAAELNEQLTRIIYRFRQAAEKRDTLTLELFSPIQQQLNITLLNPNTLATLMIKSFGRVEKGFSLIRSTRQFYPTLRIILSDDGEQDPASTRPAGKYKDFEFYPLPFDVGLSAGRNFMLDLIDTEYFVTLDDDFIMDENSVLGDLLAGLESGLDIAAGKNPVDEGKFDLDFYGVFQIDKAADGQVLTLKNGDFGRVLGTGCIRTEFVPNIFAGRTELFKNRLQWDETLKLGEHEDFFLRAKEMGVQVATCPTVSFNHDQVPHWKRRTQYDEFRNRVYDFWRLSLKKHGLVRMISFGKVMMDLIPPPALTCLTAIEVLAYSLTLDYQGCTDAVNFFVLQSENGREFRPVNAGEGGDHRAKRITIRDVAPLQTYFFAVYAGNGFEFEKSGTRTNVRTLSQREAQGPFLKNANFEGGHFGWESGLGSYFHMVESAHNGKFAGRLHVTKVGYLSKNPTPSMFYQWVDLSATPKSNWKEMIVAGWSKMERFYGGYLEWRIMVDVEFVDGAVLKYFEDFDISSFSWQVRSFTLCMRGDRVKRVRIAGLMNTYRASSLFDDFSLLLK